MFFSYFSSSSSIFFFFFLSLLGVSFFGSLDLRRGMVLLFPLVSLSAVEIGGAPWDRFHEHRKKRVPHPGFSLTLAPSHIFFFQLPAPKNKDKERKWKKKKTRKEKTSFFLFLNKKKNFFRTLFHLFPSPPKTHAPRRSWATSPRWVSGSPRPVDARPPGWSQDLLSVWGVVWECFFCFGVFFWSGFWFFWSGFGCFFKRVFVLGWFWSGLFFVFFLVLVFGPSKWSCLGIRDFLVLVGS